LRAGATPFWRGACKPDPHTALVFAITGLALAWPAALLPFVSAGKLGAERISLLFTGVGTLWNSGMRMLAVSCPAVRRTPSSRISRNPGGPACPGPASIGKKTASGSWSEAPTDSSIWAIPEVQVLAVLVAMIKLGSIVNVAIGSGFWCYCAMVFSLLIAQHTSRFNSAVPLSAAGAAGAAVPS